MSGRGPGKIHVRPLTPEQIRDILSWRYEEPYAMYNMGGDPEADRQFFSDPANGYFALVTDSGALVGFCNFGDDARVPGGDYSAAAVDIGMGLRPDLTGQGRGRFYAAAVFAYAAAAYPGQAQRTTVAEFNHRAQRLCAWFGFRPVARFRRPGDQLPFVVMLRPSAAESEARKHPGT